MTARTSARDASPAEPRTEPAAARAADQPPESGARARTRRAILEAAVAALRADKSASLGDVAQAAQVGRTTLHRYFPERADLVEAIGAEAVERTHSAITAARLDDGAPTAALRRLAFEYFDLGPWYLVLFNELSGEESDFWADSDVAEEPVRELLRRGQADGVFDDQLTVTWIVRTLWWTLFNAWAMHDEGEATRADALRMAVRSIEGVALAREARP
ncbi:TetR/AcrR family transcriptional regulator [Cellulosimicrobium protaetiae]|uniref:TetR family transcriptional regulator n=1 Tax=Cellulosimicrobium protaetiae TaxID=2587808 RepID=A0A6M5UAX0_9MICO|nr:TetR family transcriptional regulator [Cellulosimicrobium protaetiae]QJW35666.1 TetR family transcriptional regulator [Cellulosimicrobium protaetiae]